MTDPRVDPFNSPMAWGDVFLEDSFAVWIQLRTSGQGFWLLRVVVTGCEFGPNGTGSETRLPVIDLEGIGEARGPVGEQGTGGKGKEERGCQKHPDCDQKVGSFSSCFPSWSKAVWSETLRPGLACE